MTMRTVHATLPRAIERPYPDDASTAWFSIDCAKASEVDLTFVPLLIVARVTSQRLDRNVCLTSAPEEALLATLSRGGFQPLQEITVDGALSFWFQQAPE